MIKIIILIALFCSICYLGFSIANYYKKKELFYAEFLKFMEMFFNNVKFNKTKIHIFVSDFLKECKTDCKYLLQEYFINKNHEIKLSILNDSENVRIKDFLNSIGKFDVNGELNNIENHKTILVENYAKSKIDVKQYGVLYSKMGVLVALVLVIVLL